MEIQINMLTPIWTGGIEKGKMDRLHETSIIGSLRWWYEAIVRGLGGTVCDPTKHTCSYDPTRTDNGLCKVCQLFGATGWARRFRMIVQDAQLVPKAVTHPMKATRSYINNTGNQQTPTWYFQHSPKFGIFSIHLHSLDASFPLEIVQGLIQLIVDWAALGARTQMGFGLSELNSARISENPFSTLEFVNHTPDKNLPSLKNMFFACIEKDGATDTDTFNLKYDLRRLFANDKNVRHFVMGTVQGDRTGAKIFMSRPYANGLIRVWGWIPEETSSKVWNSNWNRDNVLNQIKSHLNTTPYSLETWREFNSTRDTCQQFADPKNFLNSLWEGIK